MNIFAVDKNPAVSAINLCDKHVLKMIVESCQILSTTHRILDGYVTYAPHISGKLKKIHKLLDLELETKLCKSVMWNHPCVVWVRESTSNYTWLSEHNLALCREYEQRYGKIHSMQPLATLLYERLPNNIPIDELTEFVQIMPNQYKMSNPVLGYRYYYCYEKSRFAKWKLGNVPNWYMNLCSMKEHVRQSPIDMEISTPSVIKEGL